MNLESLGFLLLFAALHGNVLADNNEVKRGAYPYMAFLYFPDEKVLDYTGLRYVRSAILIKLDVLVSSAIDDSVFDKAAIGFPRKTLIVRAGAISYDTNFTFFEDEYEQEQEVVQIIRPFGHDVLVWWRSDITVLRTLLPFKKNPSVGTVELHFLEPSNSVKNCQILVYTVNNVTDSNVRYLMQLPVDVLSMSNSSCGPNIHPDTMICSVDADENINSKNYPDFCHANGGGPLICADKVIGLQTYINNDCKQPHLYQNLYVRQKFISCATENKCNHHECENICTADNKDSFEKETSTATLIESVPSNISHSTVNAPPTTSAPLDDLETFPKAPSQEKYEQVAFVSEGPKPAFYDLTSVKSVENKYDEIKPEMVETESEEITTKNVAEVLLFSTTEAKSVVPVTKTNNAVENFKVLTTKRSSNKQDSVMAIMESTTRTEAKGLRVEVDGNATDNLKANVTPRIEESRRSGTQTDSVGKIYTSQILNLVFCLILVF